MSTVKRSWPVFVLALAVWCGAFTGARAAYNTSTGTGSALPSRYKSSLIYSYLSTTTLSISSGVCRDSANAQNMSLASATTLDMTVIGAINGTDTKTSAATATTSGTTTLTATASILTEWGTRTPTFTSFSTVTTALTGVGTKFLTEVTVNDLVGNSTKGYSRVTAIASDTALTLVAALPGGDAGGGSVGLVVIENPTIKAGSDAVRIPNTLSSAGTVVIGATSFSNGGVGQAILLGSPPPSQIHENVWLVSGTSGTGTCLSTQRTTPYAISGYTVSTRRLGAIPLNTSGQFMFASQREVGPHVVETLFEEAAGSDNNRALTNGAATTFTAVVLSAVVPPGSRQVLCTLVSNGASLRDMYVRERNVGSSTVTRCLFTTNQVASNGTPAQAWVSCDAAQCVDYAMSGASGLGQIHIVGFRESL